MAFGNILPSGLLQSIGMVGLFAKTKAAPAEPAPATPVQTQSAAESARNALRAQHGVQPVAKQYEGFSVDKLPPGVYGWTYAPAGEAPLFGSRSVQSFEVHKAAGGRAYVLAFVTAVDAEEIRSGETNGELKLYPDPYGDAVNLVPVPLEAVRSPRAQLQRGNGNCLTVTLRS